MDQQVDNPQELKQYFRYRLLDSKKTPRGIQRSPFRQIEERDTLSPK